MSEEESVLRTCWAAWDARDRPLKDVIYARSQSKRRFVSPSPTARCGLSVGRVPESDEDACPPPEGLPSASPPHSMR